MAKLSLDIEYDYNFTLIGISCHEKDYRLCWALNNVLGIELVKEEQSLEIKESRFPLYLFADENQYCEYFVIGNRCNNKLLIQEQKQADYFMKITGNLTDVNEIVKKIRDINIILTAYSIDPNSLKSKQNLLF